MYGMVHEALRELVSSRAGQEAWERVCRHAGSGTSTFLSMSTYPDAMTVSLVGQSAAELGLGGEEFLLQFGRYWIEFALRTDYGPLLRSSGKTFSETLAALDSMHARIELALPELRPPSFQVVSGGSELTLHYYSSRSGLGPFVIGLLHGLAAMHGISVAVEQTVHKEKGADHDEFRIVPSAS